MVSVEDKVLQLEFLICYIKVAILRGLKGKHTHTRTCTHMHTHPAESRASAEGRGIPDSSVLRAIAAS